MDNTIQTYSVVFALLLILLGVTIGVAYINLGTLNVLVALGIAGSKAALILWYFMHLRDSSRLVQVFALSGLLWLLVMIALTMSDYLNRAFYS